MVKQCPLVHVPLSDLAPPTTLQLLPQSPIRPILKVQQEYSGDVMTEAVRQERREKAKKSSWWWPAGVLASSMAGAAAVVAFRGCWHSKMSWPVGVQGCSYQVCLNSEVVPLVWARCGVLGGRLRLECPRCSQRVCMLYHLDGQVICRKCGRLWYTAQRTSSNGRKFLAVRKIRRKLGDYGQLRADRPPPKPPRMWRKTYARHLAAVARIERSLYLPRRR